MKARQFREAVGRLRGQVGTPAPEVEFFHNWPKHEHLTEEQLNWYLYWRTLWERGQVQKTSLSYMMIHIYELLSLEYIQDPGRAVQRLIKFYSEYRNIQPKLDVTLVRWIGDLYLKIGDLDNALYWYTQGTMGDLYEKLSWYRYGNLDIPMAVMQKVAQMPKSQFYKEHLPEIESKIEAMVQWAFRSFYAIEGEHPLDRFARYTEEPVLYLFSSTPIHEKYYLDGFRRYQQSGGFMHFVKNCMRYAENLLRRVEGKTVLKCDEDVAKYFAEQEPLYPEPVRPPAEKKGKRRDDEDALPLMEQDLPLEPVELDFSRVKSLSQETDWLVEMMGEAGAGDELLVSAERQERTPRTPVIVFEDDEPTTDALMGSLFSDGAAGELTEFLDSLGSAEQEFIRHLVRSGERERRPLSEWLKSKRMFLDATVMRINEEAMEQGLEALLLDEDTIELEDEYADEVRSWAQKE